MKIHKNLHLLLSCITLFVLVEILFTNKDLIEPIIILQANLSFFRYSSILSDEQSSSAFVIRRTLHDSDLQLQKVSLGDSTNTTIDLIVWKAVCDERDDGLKKALLIFVFHQDHVPRSVSNANFTCLSTDVYGNNLIFDKPQLHFHSYELLLIFPFERNLGCPSKVSLGSIMTPTNLLTVEKQPRRPNGDQNKSRVAICLPAMSNRVQTLEAARIAEHIEYHRQIGLTSYIMAYLNPETYPTDISLDTEAVVNYFENTGFLEKYSAPALDIPDPGRMYSDFLRTQYHSISYCFVKNALRFDYIIVQDFDEIVGFDTGKFPSIAQAIEATREQFGLKYRSFMLKDVIVNHRCIESAHQFNYSKSVIAHINYTHKRGDHMGKTIHGTDSCLYIRPHFCDLQRSSTLIGHANVTNSSAQSTDLGHLLKVKSMPENQQLMKSFHMASPYRHTGKQRSFLNSSAWCTEDNISQTNWTEPISEILKNKVKQVLNILDIVN